jgi:hypothetical protein
LAAMEPSGPYGAGGQTVQNRIDQLVQARAGIQAFNQQASPIWDSMSEQDWMSYQNRSAAFGEESALVWLVGKLGQK